MSKFRVIERFADLEDNKQIYEVGDFFPRLGLDVSDDRLSELSTGRNKIGRPLIKEVFVKETKEAVWGEEKPQKEAEKKAEVKPKTTTAKVKKPRKKNVG